MGHSFSLMKQVHLSLTPLVARTWAPRGHTPTIMCNFNWKRISAIGGMDLDGEIHFRLHEGSIRKEQVIEYLEQILRHIPGCIVILWDGVPPHRAGDVTKFTELHKDRLSIYRLPPYCPEFNPMEWFWAEVKWNRMKGFCPKDIPELRKKLLNIIRALRRKPELIRSYFSASSLPLGQGASTKLCRYQ